MIEIVDDEVFRHGLEQLTAHGVARAEGAHHSAPENAPGMLDGVFPVSISFLLVGDAVVGGARIEHVGRDQTELWIAEMFGQFLGQFRRPANVGVTENQDVVAEA